MKVNALCSRLMLAIVVPVMLITAFLYPLSYAYLEARIDGSRVGAQAMLESGREALQRRLNECFDDIVATSRMPLLKYYLDSVQTRQSPFPSTAQQLTAERLALLFDTLLTHSGRYTTLMLLNTRGQELLHVKYGKRQDKLSTGRSYADSVYFQEAMQLAPGELYISPPTRQPSYENANDSVVPIISIATPVFDNEGRRKGVLLSSVDWQSLTTDMRHAMSIDSTAQPILIDGQGNWLLAKAFGTTTFGRNFKVKFPEQWESLSQQDHGQVEMDDRLLLFQTIDIRTRQYRSLASGIYSTPSYYPWQLGILVSKPRLTTLFDQDVPVLLIFMLYALAILPGIVWAISSHRQQLLKREAQQYAKEVRNLYDYAPCGYHSLNAEGRVVQMNRTELEWLGYRAEEVIDRLDYSHFITPETREAFEEAFQGVLGPDQEGSAECALRTRAGTTIPVIIQATAYRTSRGFVHSRATVFDLTERKQLEETLARQAMTDPLTGLGNRRYLQDQAVQEIARAERSGEPLALIAIDLDHFKHINDTYGHDVGDRVLQAFAETGRQLLRDGDVLCRMGGEEFAVLLVDTSQSQAIHIAERLRLTLENSPVEVDPEVTGNGWLHYTASLGVTAILVGETSLKPAIKRADLGLYAAKEQGRNRVHWQPAQ
ncbi:diguanylate cyclase [Salinicola sp. LHM]|uniref:diguanylate cyclase n=1 Tax=Salinicola sp. LHM TaxID=3065298 RepID=UPI002ACEAFC9|nr:diguanylate cyclase [Salinicola sp. LHM]WQH34535.1 diguanylate cyclase [Salinicola sp. LHM]